ncbi:MAG: hypothetical protein AAB657_01365 [Patescibacteria group bacterium]
MKKISLFLLLTFVAMVGNISSATAQTVASKYQNAYNLEQKGLLVEALTEYVQIVDSESAVKIDIKRVAAELVKQINKIEFSKNEYGSSLVLFSGELVMRHHKKLPPALMEAIYQAYVKSIEVLGFNMDKNYYIDAQNRSWLCNYFDYWGTSVFRDIRYSIYPLCKEMKWGQRQKLWGRQLAEISLFGAQVREDGSSYFDPELAYVYYSEIDDFAMARVAAKKIGDLYFSYFCDGYPKKYSFNSELKPGLQENFNSAIRWYQCAGLTDKEIKQKVTSESTKAEQNQRYGIALTLYKYLGDSHNVKRMTLLTTK